MIPGLELAFMSEGRASPKYRTACVQKLRKIVRVFRDMGCPELGMIGEAEVLRWVGQRGGEVFGRTLFHELHLLARFFAWLVREGIVLTSPVPEWLLERSCPDYVPRRVPSLGEIMDVLGGGHGKWLPIRNLAILEMLYGCGLRCAELAGIRLVDWRGTEVRITGKLGAERIVPVCEVASSAVVRWLDTERAKLLRYYGVCEDFLFVSRCGRRLRPSAISNILRLQVKASFTPHQLRHACATHMLRNGASIVVLRDLLGHKGITTTRVYTEVKVEDMRKGLERFHPRENSGVA